MKSHNLSFITSAVLAFATFQAAAATELVTNGSFERTTLGASGAISNANLPGWSLDLIGTFNIPPHNYTAVYFSAAEAVTTGATGTNNPEGNWIMAKAGNSPDGGKFVAIDGDRRVWAVLSQRIDGLTVGHNYDLKFQMAGAQEDEMFGATTDSWQVYFGNDTRTSTVLQNESHGFTGWVDQTMTFTASASSQVLAFLAVGTPSGLPPVSLLDGVSLTENVAAVPEPGTWALLLAGLGMVGAVMRKRRS